MINAVSKQFGNFKERLNILLLSYRSNPLSGGQGVYIHYLSKALVDLGHKVDVVSGIPYPVLDSRVQLHKLPGLDLYSEGACTGFRWRYLFSRADISEWLSIKSGGFPEPYTFGLRLWQWMQANGRSYDIVHDNQSLCLGLLRLQAAGWPLLTTIHHPITIDLETALHETQTDLDKWLVRRWYNFLKMQKKVARQLNHIATVSENSKIDSIKEFNLHAKRIRVIHNGIEGADFKVLPDIESIPGRIITTASADSPIKGLHILLKALAQLVTKYTDIKLVVIGTINPKGRAQQLISKLGLDDKVTLRAKLTTMEICHLYAESSIAVVPSLYEGFGLPAGEAMSCGVPVISSDAGSLPEVVGDAGVLVAKGDVEALAGAIERLHNDANLRAKLIKAGIERVAKLFSWPVAAASYVDFYRDIIAHGT